MFLCPGGRRAPFTWEFLSPVFWERRKIRVPWLHLLFPSCLWLEAILLSKWPVLGLNVLPLFTGIGVCVCIWGDWRLEFGGSAKTQRSRQMEAPPSCHVTISARGFRVSPTRKEARRPHIYFAVLQPRGNPPYFYVQPAHRN